MQLEEQRAEEMLALATSPEPVSQPWMEARNRAGTLAGDEGLPTGAAAGVTGGAAVKPEDDAGEEPLCTGNVAGDGLPTKGGEADRACGEDARAIDPAQTTSTC